MSLKISEFPVSQIHNTCDYVPFIRKCVGGDWCETNYRALASDFTSLNVISASYSNYSETSSYAMNGGTGGGGSNVVVSDTAPLTNLINGTLWWNSLTGVLKIYYYDGDSYQWVDAAYVAAVASNLSSSYAMTASFALGGYSGSGGGGGIIIQDIEIGSTVRCGSNNHASGSYSTVIGGTGSFATGNCSAIVGGTHNIASGINSFIGGGSYNTASQSWGVIGGGSNNFVGDNCSGILGGQNNRLTGHDSFIIGSNLTGTSACTTYVNNLYVSGSLCAPLADTVVMVLGTGIGSTVRCGNSNCATGNCSTIGGGSSNCDSGSWNVVGGGANNTVSGTNSFIGGGRFNTACTGGDSVIAGGILNVACGVRNFIGGGDYNVTSGSNNVVVGGGHNCSSGPGWGSAVVAGTCNTASGLASFVGAGYYNYANGSLSGILGGNNNVICSTANESFIVGSNLTASVACTTYVNNLNICGNATRNGSPILAVSDIIMITGSGVGSTMRCGNSNIAIGNCSTVSGGSYNCVSGSWSVIGGGCGNINNGTGSFIGSGACNCICGDCNTIAGGRYNCISSSQGGGGFDNSIGGGNGNKIIGPYDSIIGGGSGNCIIDTESVSVNSTIAGGSSSCIYNTNWGTVGGGLCNCVVSGSNWSTIAGGGYNCVSHKQYSTIAGGQKNCVCADRSGILGGQYNCILNGANDSFIVGSNLTASAACTTYVNNLCVGGTLFAGTSSKTTNGYTYLPGGLLMQWGKTGPFANESGITTSFPLAFPTALLNAQATILGSTSGAANDVVVAIFSPTTTSMVTFVNTTTGGTSYPYCVYWTAIGY